MNSSSSNITQTSLAKKRGRHPSFVKSPCESSNENENILNILQLPLRVGNLLHNKEDSTIKKYRMLGIDINEIYRNGFLQKDIKIRGRKPKNSYMSIPQSHEELRLAPHHQPQLESLNTTPNYLLDTMKLNKSLRESFEVSRSNFSLQYCSSSHEMKMSYNGKVFQFSVCYVDNFQSLKFHEIGIKSFLTYDQSCRLLDQMSTFRACAVSAFSEKKIHSSAQEMFNFMSMLKIEGKVALLTNRIRENEVLLLADPKKVNGGFDCDFIIFSVNAEYITTGLSIGKKISMGFFPKDPNVKLVLRANTERNICANEYEFFYCSGDGSDTHYFEQKEMINQLVQENIQVSKEMENLKCLMDKQNEEIIEKTKLLEESQGMGNKFLVKEREYQEQLKLSENFIKDSNGCQAKLRFIEENIGVKAISIDGNFIVEIPADMNGEDNLEKIKDDKKTSLIETKENDNNSNIRCIFCYTNLINSVLCTCYHSVYCSTCCLLIAQTEKEKKKKGKSKSSSKVLPTISGVHTGKIKCPLCNLISNDYMVFLRS